jgi:coenzyme F420-reducing hydrogenase delta subunit
MRLGYSPDIKIIRVPCTGKVDVIHILHALEKGADGVYIVGCLEGDCHFLHGNLLAKKRVQRARKILESIGLEGDRVRMYNLSSGEGPKFAEYAKEMDQRIRELGPSPIKSGLSSAA